MPVHILTNGCFRLACPKMNRTHTSEPPRKSRFILFGIVFVFATLIGHPVSAACTDSARPNANWERCYMVQRNLAATDLSGAQLRDTRFNRSNLDGSNLSAVDAHRAKFISASMKNVIFDNAHLTESDFTKANLQGASFVRADLRRTRLFRANLRGANFTGARLTAADFLKADLSGATWIDGKTVCAEGSIGQCK